MNDTGKIQRKEVWLTVSHKLDLPLLWSENYALLPNVTANDPALIDRTSRLSGGRTAKKGQLI